MSSESGNVSISKGRALFLCLLVYLAAAGAAVISVSFLEEAHPIIVVAVADLTATVVVFFFSAALNNSSMYDPYWSVAPVVIGFYFLSLAMPMQGFPIKQIIVLSLLCFWAVRLTVNWIITWSGVTHEDWRYRNIREKTGRAYWLASFLGIQLLPTLVVFFGCISFLPALTAKPSGLGALDYAGTAVVVCAVLLELFADRQVHRFKKESNGKGAVCTRGLWRYSRHPNYLGEILFWWGVFLFGVSAGFSWISLPGPVLITLLFLFISIPMMEKHLSKSRPSYGEYKKETSVLIPLPVRKNR